MPPDQPDRSPPSVSLGAVPPALVGRRQAVRERCQTPCSPGQEARSPFLTDFHEYSFYTAAATPPAVPLVAWPIAATWAVPRKPR